MWIAFPLWFKIAFFYPYLCILYLFVYVYVLDASPVAAVKPEAAVVKEDSPMAATDDVTEEKAPAAVEETKGNWISLHSWLWKKVNLGFFFTKNHELTVVVP